MQPMDESDVYAQIGQRIRVRRVILGIGEKRLAKEAGISFYMIRRYEAGQSKISMDRLDKIGNVLNVPEWYFFEAIE